MTQKPLSAAACLLPLCLASGSCAPGSADEHEQYAAPAAIFNAVSSLNGIIAPVVPLPAAARQKIGEDVLNFSRKELKEDDDCSDYQGHYVLLSPDPDSAGTACLLTSFSVVTTICRIDSEDSPRHNPGVLPFKLEPLETPYDYVIKEGSGIHVSRQRHLFLKNPEAPEPETIQPDVI